MAPSHALPPIRLWAVLAQRQQGSPAPFTTSLAMEEWTRVSSETTIEEHPPTVAPGPRCKILPQVMALH